MLRDADEALVGLTPAGQKWSFATSRQAEHWWACLCVSTIGSLAAIHFFPYLSEFAKYVLALRAFLRLVLKQSLGLGIKQAGTLLQDVVLEKAFYRDICEPCRFTKA